MRHVETLLKTYQLGDRLSDAELEYLGTEAQKLADSCWLFGEMFRLQAVYAEKVARDCREYLASRQESKIRVIK